MSATLLHLFRQLYATENFTSRRMKAAGFSSPEVALAGFSSLPFTSKADLLEDYLEHPPFGTNYHAPLTRCTRFCQTSGTSTGQPMAWLDTPESWQAMLHCWRRVFIAAELVPGVDRICFAFGFGPFLGFWTAFEAATTDYLSLPTGSLSSLARLQLMARYSATVLCCTPTYAMRLGELIGAESGITHEQLSVKKLIVAGEPGGSVPAVRARLEQLWQARVFDHHGMTEVGPVSYETVAQPGVLHVIEEAYHAEVVDVDGNEVPEGECGELVLTNLTRLAAPLVRYRTGDLVRKRLLDGRLALEGGILGRLDEMLVIRGVNVYPSAIEGIVREFPEIVEFQARHFQRDAMDEIEVLIEPQAQAVSPEDLAQRLADRLRAALSLRIPVRLACDLPRHEFKSRRWVKG